MTINQYNDLIERWNHLRPRERRDRADDCRDHGHDWDAVPGTNGRTKVCRKCISYVEDDREVAA